MRKIIIAICIMILVGVTSYIVIAGQSPSQSLSLPYDEQGIEGTNKLLTTPLTLEEEIAYFKQGIEAAKHPNFQLNDPELEKWILRTITFYKMMGLDYTDEEIIEQARKEKQETEDYINDAKTKYGIEVTEEMYDDFITNYISVLDEDLENKQAFAELLGLTMHEYNYEFDRDLNTRLLVWTLLEPSGFQSSLEFPEQQIHDTILTNS